jgi:hypothetical protein
MRRALIPAYLPQRDGSSEGTRRKKRSPIMKSLGRNFIKIGNVFAKSV